MYIGTVESSATTTVECGNRYVSFGEEKENDDTRNTIIVIRWSRRHRFVMIGSRAQGVPVPI